VTLSTGGSVRVVATELPSSATLAECRGKVASSASPLRFGRRPRAIRVHVASEGIVETVPLELSLAHSKVLSSLCARFELPTTNEYVLTTLVNGELRGARRAANAAAVGRRRALAARRRRGGRRGGVAT
jgi:hypothetical protein